MFDSTTQNTASLFGDLWHRYDNDLFEQSVALFPMRFKANGFDLNWFRGKRCLDAGCGGGRYAIAMARLGAAEVIGCDISEQGLTDARRRAVGLPNIRFELGSVMELPYPDGFFDFVCCSGVLHHTSDPLRGLHELGRILRAGGRLFLLLYGTGGLRWPMIMKLRSHAQEIGYDLMNQAMRLSGLPANKQRTFLDDFFVPLIHFYDWNEVKTMLAGAGFHSLERWEKGKLDHEENISVLRTEFVQLLTLFSTISQRKEQVFQAAQVSARRAIAIVEATLEHLDTIEVDYETGRLDENTMRWQVFGWGHHRILAIKG